MLAPDKLSDLERNAQMKTLALKILTDKSARTETSASDLAVQLAASFSPWSQAPVA
jgi:hypothetical protein